MQPRFGKCIISFIPDTTELFNVGMKFGIILPKSMQKKALLAYVHTHNASLRFGEDLTGKEVVADRWSGTRFTIVHKDGKEYEFYSISEWAILCVVDS